MRRPSALEAQIGSCCTRRFVCQANQVQQPDAEAERMSPDAWVYVRRFDNDGVCMRRLPGIGDASSIIDRTSADGPLADADGAVRSRDVARIAGPTAAKHHSRTVRRNPFVSRPPTGPDRSPDRSTRFS